MESPSRATAWIICNWAAVAKIPTNLGSTRVLRPWAAKALAATPVAPKKPARIRNDRDQKSDIMRFSVMERG